MKKTDIWMPIYVADYLADTTRLKTIHHGAYMLLIMEYWRQGPLPDDDEALASITRSSATEWRKLRKMLSPFFQLQDGVWLHKRIESELAKARDNRQQKSEAGKASALKRKAQHNRQGQGDHQLAHVAADAPREFNENATPVATCVATERATEPQRRGNPSSSPSPSPINHSVETSSSIPLAVVSEPDSTMSAIRSRTLEFAVLLRQRGASVTPADPQLLGWAQEGVTDAQALQALDFAKEAREFKRSAQPIGAGYLDQILRNSILAGEGNTTPSKGRNAARAAVAASIFKPEYIEHLTGERHERAIN